MEGKGFFTKEIEEALLNNDVDLAIHSHKDLETTYPDGLTISAVPQRTFVEDLLLIRKESAAEDAVFEIKPDAVIGTSSARRKTQLKHHLPNCQTKDLRGNVPTRVNKLREGQYDAIVLAKAGVTRLELDLSDLHVVDLPEDSFVPAPAQGALAVQTREDDSVLNEHLSKLNNTHVQKQVNVERTLLKELQGGCQLPFGAYCHSEGEEWKLHVAIAKDADSQATFFHLEGNDPDVLLQEMLPKIKSIHS